jgi:hypothetical protein
MKPELQDILQHHGVKGMHWGKVKSHVDSVKREHSLRKTVKNADNMSTKDIQKVGARAQLENDMKRLSKEKHVGSKKDKADYLKRADMPDQELLRKVQRLRAKSNLKRIASDATKTQREMGKRVMQVAGTIGLHYALTGKVDKKVVAGAVIGAAVAAGGEKARMLKNLHDQSKNIKKNNTKHGIEDEETLQHHGVKGMHWGVRKKLGKMIKDRRAKHNKQMLDAHDKLMKKHKTYKKLYNHNSKRYKTHLGAVQKTHHQLREIHRQRVHLAATAAVLAAPHLAPHIGKAAHAVGKAAQNPDNIRKAKNVAQALKRSPIRYVNGKAMKNVIN